MTVKMSGSGELVWAMARIPHLLLEAKLPGLAWMGSNMETDPKI